MSDVHRPMTDKPNARPCTEHVYQCYKCGAGMDTTSDHEQIKQIKAEIQTLQEANRIDRAKVALLEALEATDD